MSKDAMYLRKSRVDLEAERHGAGDTLARHKQALMAVAKSHGLNITKIYQEVVSGETITARPEMQKLLHDVEAGMWDSVLVYEVERLARSVTCPIEGINAPMTAISRRIRISEIPKRFVSLPCVRTNRESHK